MGLDELIHSVTLCNTDSNLYNTGYSQKESLDGGSNDFHNAGGKIQKQDGRKTRAEHLKKGVQPLKGDYAGDRVFGTQALTRCKVTYCMIRPLVKIGEMCNEQSSCAIASPDVSSSLLHRCKADRRSACHLC